MGPPYLFLQLLKLANSNLLYNLKLYSKFEFTTWAWAVAYQETTFRTKTDGVWAGALKMREWKKRE